MEAQLRFLAAEGVDLIVTSGGLGPTADDLTTEVVARFQGRAMVLDPELEERIAAIVAPLTRRWRNIDPEAVAVGTRKQATVPDGRRGDRARGDGAGRGGAAGRRPHGSDRRRAARAAARAADDVAGGRGHAESSAAAVGEGSDFTQ